MKPVIVRTYSAGVHFGYLIERNGKECTLSNSRRIWSWRGANSLNEISVSGVGNGSKVSEPVKNIILTECIEIIECTENSVKNIESIGWAK